MKKPIACIFAVFLFFSALSACEIQTTPPYTPPASEPPLADTTADTTVTADDAIQPADFLPYPGYSIQARTYQKNSASKMLLSEYRFTEDGGIETFSYSSYNQTQSITRYNAYGDRVRSTKKSGGKITEETTGTYTYNEDGKPLTRILYDSINDITDRYEYTYDEAGRLIQEEQWNPGTRYEHILTAYIYDEAGRLTQIVSDDFVGDLCTYTVYYTYDESGRLIEKTRNHSQAIWRYAYYEDGALKSAEYIQNYIVHEHTLKEYNPDGTISRKYRTELSGDYFEKLYEYAYETNADGKLERISSYALDEHGTRTLNNVYEKEYDADGRLIRCELTAGEDKGQKYPLITYEYDACGNLLSVKKYSETGRLVSSETHTYKYDEYGRIKEKDNCIYEYADCTAEQYALYEMILGHSAFYYFPSDPNPEAAPGKTQTENTNPPETSVPTDVEIPETYAPTLLDSGYIVPEDGKPIIQYVNGIPYINGVLIVNKTYALPENYDPGQLHPDAKTAFDQMKKAAAEAGLSLKIASGYRSYALQSRIYGNYTARDGQENADRYSARPGHSEHQSGLAIDVNVCEDWFADSPEGIWLAEHCAEYGFIIRYPKDKEAETGYMYEPWHIRYLGKELAAAVTESGLCLEEYLGITSAYEPVAQPGVEPSDLNCSYPAKTYKSNGSTPPSLLSEFRFTADCGIEELYYKGDQVVYSALYDARGDSIRMNEYKQNGPLISTMTGTHTYDSQGRPLIHNLTGGENEMNYRYEYEYDEKGRLIRAESWCPSCQCEHVCISYQYNDADQVILRISQGGIPSGITEYTYDMQGRLIEAIHEQSKHIRRYTYYDDGTMRSSESISNIPLSMLHTLIEYNPDGHTGAPVRRAVAKRSFRDAVRIRV